MCDSIRTHIVYKSARASNVIKGINAGRPIRCSNFTSATGARIPRPSRRPWTRAMPYGTHVYLFSASAQTHTDKLRHATAGGNFAFAPNLLWVCVFVGMMMVLLMRDRGPLVGQRHFYCIIPRGGEFGAGRTTLDRTIIASNNK